MVSTGGIWKVIVSLLLILSAKVYSNTRLYGIVCVYNTGSVL